MALPIEVSPVALNTPTWQAGDLARGITRAAPLLFFAIILPKVMEEFFASGLKDATIIVVGSALVSTFLSIFLGWHGRASVFT